MIGQLVAPRLGELLIDENLVTEEQLREALRYQKANGGRLGSCLVNLGHVSEDDIAAVLSRQYGVPSVDLSQCDLDEEVIALLTTEAVNKHQVVPLKRRGQTLSVAMVDPLDMIALSELEFMTGFDIEAMIAPESQVRETMAKYYGKTYDVGLELIELLTTEAVNKYQVVPLERQGQTLSVGVVDPLDTLELSALKVMTGFDIEPVIVPESQVRETITKYYGKTYDVEFNEAVENLADAEDESIEVVEEEEEEIDMEALARKSEETPTIRLVNAMLLNAYKQGASDIHLEPSEQQFRVRFRVDGRLKTVLVPPSRFKEGITSRIKIMAKLDITQRRRAQDGRIRIRLKPGGKIKDLDFRVSIVPTLYGEKVVLRLLDRENLMTDMGRLGFEPKSLKSFELAIQKPFGMVLVTGPTVSGKTTTLYSLISKINSPDKNFMTVEDPVEFSLPGINQVKINEKSGSSFADVLRSFLRQDPDVVLLGEIRDLDTADIAIKAALTGHLVLSSLHTNDAASAVTRLIDLGITPFLVATAVHLICAQRLVRRLCDECKVETQPPTKTLIDVGFSAEEARTVRVFGAVGCSSCNKMGYRGRVGLYEVMEITDELKDIIMLGGTASELKRKAIESGMMTLRCSGLTKIKDGLTSIEEILRETIQ